MKAFNFIKKKLQLRCEYWEILRTLILKNTCKRLLLYYVSYFGKNDENKLICVYIHTLVENDLMIVAKSKPFHQNLIFWSKCPFYVVSTFRAVPVVKQGTMGGIFGKKIRKSIDSKDQIRLCFHKREKTNKNSVTVSVHRKGFLFVWRYLLHMR